MKSNNWIILAIFFTLMISIVNVQTALCDSFDRDMPFEPPPWRDLLPQLLLIKAVLSSVNSILLVILLAIYLGIYHRTSSEFSLGLLIFTIALLLYTLTSNPLIHMVAGFRLSGLGPFTMLPDLFTCFASAILLYLSQQ